MYGQQDSCQHSIKLSSESASTCNLVPRKSHSSAARQKSSEGSQRKERKKCGYWQHDDVSCQYSNTLFTHPISFQDCSMVVAQSRLFPTHSQKVSLVREMEVEFKQKRKLVISGIPLDSLEEVISTLTERLHCTQVSDNSMEGKVTLLFPNNQATKKALNLIKANFANSSQFSACVVKYRPHDSLLFIGNIPYRYTRQNLLSLCEPYGEIIRCLVVCSEETGLAKGYGFVEYARKEEARKAKKMMATTSVGQRNLRVDFADYGMLTFTDLHSRTLFVDHLPKGFYDDNLLRALFSKFGVVNFCQVAISEISGIPRCFAFVDMACYFSAEHAHQMCNGALLWDQEIRVSFGMPCRLGSSILQHNKPRILPLGASSSSPDWTSDIGQAHGTQAVNGALAHWDSFLQWLNMNQMPCHGQDTMTFIARQSLLEDVIKRVIKLLPQLGPPPNLSLLSSNSHGSFSERVCPAPSQLSPPSLNGYMVDLEVKRESAASTHFPGSFIGQHEQGITYMDPMERIREDIYVAREWSE